MTTIEHLRIGPEIGTATLWPEIATRLRHRLDTHGAPIRDAVVLVPYAALIDPARRAFAAAGGWQPRIETPATLAAALGPPAEPPPGAPTGDVVLDRLRAEQLLRESTRLPPGLPDAHAAALFADAATTLAAETASRPPAQRGPFRQMVRDELAGREGGAAGLDTLLLLAAAEWASGAAAPATDQLFGLAPSAWAVVRVGGADRLAEALLPEARTLGVLIDLDIAEPPTWPAPGAGALLQRWVTDDRESEAMASAATVLDALGAGAGRVALAVLDRALARRVVALLARRGVEVSDETGWRLSTTPAATRLLARLRAMAPDAGPDEGLDWLKSSRLGDRWSVRVAQLESHWRGRGAGREPLPGVQALLLQIEERRLPWGRPAVRLLGDWLTLLWAQLEADGDLEAWRRLPGGEPLLRLLQRVAALAPRLTFDLGGFTRWAETACEAEAAEPPLGGAAARVVVAPLSRLIARPFDHIVLPGADEVRLGGVEPAGTLLGELRAQRLGLDVAAQERRRRRQLALAQLLRAPRLTLLRRRFEHDEPLAPSPDVESIERAALAAGRPLAAEEAWQPRRRAVKARPPARPSPRAVNMLPQRLSASAVEALRECPYRFFSRYVLGLAQVEELQAEPGKREYGTWLHEALRRFHERRSGGDDAGELHAAADEAIDHLDLDRAALLPFRASVDTLVPAYLAWLSAHEHEGWRWSEGEVELEAAPAGWAPQRVRGIVDRIDRGPGGARMIVDYKTGSFEGLRSRVRSPLEDTQLAYYAALLLAREGAEGPLRAGYLALDHREGPRLVEHERVADSADMLLKAIAGELRRIRGGAPLPPLGEGAVCETCEARGLCRRDHWPAVDSA